MAVKYLATGRLQGTIAEREALTGGVDKAGIKAYYQFEEATSGNLINQATSGNGFADGTGSTNDGSSTGSGVSRVSGKVGSYAYEFNGASTASVLIGNGLISGTGNYSISVWAWKDADVAQTMLYLGNTQEMMNYSYSTKKMSGHNTPAVHATTSFNLGQWHHGVVTREGTVAKMYYDGTLEATGSNSTSINTTAGRIGGISAVDEQWDGKLDELIIADRVFTADEVSAIYNSGTGGTLASMPLITLNLPNGTIFEESDGTGKHYMWDGTSAWNEVT